MHEDGHTDLKGLMDQCGAFGLRAKKFPQRHGGEGIGVDPGTGDALIEKPESDRPQVIQKKQKLSAYVHEG